MMWVSMKPGSTVWPCRSILMVLRPALASTSLSLPTATKRPPAMDAAWTMENFASDRHDLGVIEDQIRRGLRPAQARVQQRRRSHAPGQQGSVDIMGSPFPYCLRSTCARSRSSALRTRLQRLAWRGYPDKALPPRRRSRHPPRPKLHRIVDDLLRRFGGEQLAMAASRVMREAPATSLAQAAR